MIMNKKKWFTKIKSLMRKAGTYQKHFDPVAVALAEILEQRDHAYEEYVENGANLLVEKVSDRGAVNMVKNPLLTTWNELNTTALQYWRECGLTPASLKKLNESAMKQEKGSSLQAALEKLSSGA